VPYIYGTAAYDSLTGTSGDDHIYRDDMTGNPATADEIGNMFYGSLGNDTLYGVQFAAQSDYDTINYSGAGGGVYVNLGSGYAGKTALTTGTVTSATATIGQDTLYYFENVIGSAYGDRIYGYFDHHYPGAAGHFTYDGGAGDDIIYGGNTDDWLIGGSGNDILVSSLADLDHVDTMAGDSGLDTFVMASTGFIVITDFTPADDVMNFDYAALGLTHGGTANLVIDGPATGSDHAFLYNSGTGALRFDPDGAGPEGPISLFVTLSPGLSLTAADIHF